MLNVQRMREEKPSNNLSWLVSFDIESVYDDEGQTIRFRKTSCVAGYIAEFILNSPSIARHCFLVEYTICIVRLYSSKLLLIN